LLIDRNTKAQHRSTTEAQNHNDYPESRSIPAESKIYSSWN
jgi:hypothetical protein